MLEGSGGGNTIGGANPAKFY